MHDKALCYTPPGIDETGTRLAACSGSCASGFQHLTKGLWLVQTLYARWPVWQLGPLKIGLVLIGHGGATGKG